MGNITIALPDSLIALYNEARASWNPFIEARGGVLLPAPTKTALETFMRAHPEKLLTLLESIVVDWPDKAEFMKGIAAILSSETEPFVPSFSDFDVDEPKMITYYACLLRQRYGGPLPVSV